MGVATVVVAILILVLVALAIAIRFARRPANRDAADDRPDALDGSPEPVVEAVSVPPEVVAEVEEPTITWTAQFTSAALDESERLCLINDLVMLRAAWSVTLLRRAHEEERAPHIRARIEEALAICGEPVADLVR